ncbi:MAG: Asp-tRNA(Asn)/Glu-tRNA(Gln) amidotransferase subunit GatC [Gammaproteobacteria bacterium]|nr:Asp-tRNA(Asn)/Glu-tRNA(Gln) amidotransferase subunit GatC [Gammaproteobacteria bacterium]
MALDDKTILGIAQLARLAIPQQEVDRYRQELSGILELVAQMDACDTSAVQPMTHPFDATLRLRADEVTEIDQRDKFQSLAPAASDGLYLVPKVID